MSVSENIQRQGTLVLWVSSDAQLADGLTKAAAQDFIRAFLVRGQTWNVKFDPLFQAAKKKKKNLATNLPTEPSEWPSQFGDMTWTEFLQHQMTHSDKSLWGVSDFQV